MKKRILSLALVLLFLFSLAACAQKSGDARSVTVTVVHGSGAEKTFTYESEEQYLGAVLVEEGLIAGEEGPYGLFVKTVDGETADDAKEQWWCLTKNGGGTVETGVDATEFADGDTFELTLKEGW